MGAAGKAFYQRELAIDVAVDQFRDLFHRLTQAESWDRCSARVTP
jgi:hypothetical protein